MVAPGKGKPSKVELTAAAKAVIAGLVPQLQAERDNYQLGIGTVIAELIEKLAERPDLLRELLYGEDAGSLPKRQRKR